MLPATLYLLAFGLIAFLFPLSLFIIAKILGPRRPSPVKGLSVECGEVPVGEGRSKFAVQYWPYAIIFVIFDIFAVFFLLSASALYRPMIEAPAPLLVFIAIFVAALLYSWKALIERVV